jgi:hypothetical protein
VIANDGAVGGPEQRQVRLFGSVQRTVGQTSNATGVRSSCSLMATTPQPCLVRLSTRPARRPAWQEVAHQYGIAYGRLRQRRASQRRRIMRDEAARGCILQDLRARPNQKDDCGRGARTSSLEPLPLGSPTKCPGIPFLPDGSTERRLCLLGEPWICGTISRYNLPGSSRTARHCDGAQISARWCAG